MPIAAGMYFTENNAAASACPPVILIHGCGSDHTCWPVELRRLRGFRVLTLDLPGHGRSAGLAQHSIERYCKNLTDFMDALDLYRAVLVGHSMGGAVALSTACQHPKRVTALGLIASAAYLGVPADILNNLAHPNTMPLAMKSLHSKLFSPRTPSSIIEKTRNQLSAVRPGVLYADYQAAADYDLRNCISQLQTPVWIAAGNQDGMIPLSYVRYLTSSLPNSRLCLVESAGHLLMLEAPKMVSDKLSEFLRDLDQSPEIKKFHVL